MQIERNDEGSLFLKIASINILIGSSTKDVDVSALDVVLISNAEAAQNLPTLLQYSRFMGRAFTSEPVAHTARLILEELATLSPSCPFTCHDVDACLSELHLLSYKQTVVINPILQLYPVPSGFSVGSCNWILQTPYEVIGVIMESSLNVRRHPIPLDSVALHACDIIVVGPCLRIHSSSEASSALPIVCAAVESTLKQSGNVLIPVSPCFFFCDLLEYLHSYLTSKSLGHVNMYFISPVGKALASYLSVSGEWINASKRSPLFEGKAPLGLEDLINKQRLHIFSDATDKSNFPSTFQQSAIVFSGLKSLDAGDITLFVKMFGNDNRCSLINTDPSSVFLPMPGSVSTMKVIQCPVDVRLSVDDLCKLVHQSMRCKHLVCPSEYSISSQATSIAISTFDMIQPVTISLKLDYQPAFLEGEYAQTLKFVNSRAPVSGMLSWHEGRAKLTADSRVADGGYRNLCGPLTISSLITALHRQGFEDAVVVSMDPSDLSVEEALSVDIQIPSLQTHIQFFTNKTIIHCQDNLGRLAIAEIVRGCLSSI